MTLIDRFIYLYQYLIRFGTWLQSPLLLILRLYWGFGFVQTGIGKFMNVDRVAAFFQSLSIPFPYVNVYIVATIETVGGLFLLMGFLSRLISLPLIGVLLTAYATAHLDVLLNIFHDPEQFLNQDPFHFLLTCVIVLAFGPGRISIDACLKHLQ